MSKKYELSLWQDYPGVKEIKEEKVAILATNGMEYSGRAQNIILSPSYTGEINLTFEIPVKYFDSLAGEWVVNPLARKVQVKSKLKLWRAEHWYNKYANPVYDKENNIWTFTPQWEDERWYDFIVNQRAEKRSKKKISYEFTCVSLFVNELSRTGYSLEFKSDSANINENSIGTAHQLAEKITRDTDWQYMKSEIFPDYKSVFNSTTGEITKIPVETEQIEFLDGLKQYDYCYTLKGEDEDIKKAVDSALAAAKEKGYITDGQYGWTDEYTFWWKKKPTDLEEKKYIYGHDRREYITAYADKYIAEESGAYADAGYTGIPAMSDLTGGWVNSNHKDLGIGCIKEGTGLGTQSIRYYRTFDFSLYDRYFNLNAENTRLPCGTLLNVQVILHKEDHEGLKLYIYEGKDWTADNQYGEPACSLELAPPTTVDNPFVNSYYFRVPSTIEKPHFAIGRNITNQGILEFSSILIYKMVGYTEELNEKLLNVSGSGLVKKLTSLFPTSQYDLTNNKTSTDSPIWLPLGDITQSDYTQENIEYLIETYKDGEYHQIYLPLSNVPSYYLYKIADYNADKRRAISGEKSNRFSLLTTVCETFKCFFKFIVLHNENGTIQYLNGSPAKFYTLVSTLGNNQFNGFTYGVNLEEVSRTVDATNLVSKLYVENIDNQYKNTGLVSIQQSKYNDLKENFVYNFGYYLLRGLINRDTFNKDYNIMRDKVYNTNAKLEQLNEEYLQIKQKKQTLDTEVYTLKAVNSALTSTVQKCLEDINWDTLYNYNEENNEGKVIQVISTGVSGNDLKGVGTEKITLPYKTTVGKGDYISAKKNSSGTVEYYIGDSTSPAIVNTETLDNWDNSLSKVVMSHYNDQSIRRIQNFPNIDISPMCVYLHYRGVMAEILLLNTFEAVAEFAYNSRYYFENSGFSQICGLKQETIVNTLETVSAYQVKYKQNLNTIALDEEALNGENGYNIQLTSKETEINELIAEKNRTISDFEKKYAQYIIEGTWKGDDYVDNDVYYLDATQTSAESCMPKVEYSISALDISKLSNPVDPTDTTWGESFSYDVGDTTYIKDQDLFGATDGTIVEQKSMVATKDIYIDVDKPDDIELRNYDTRFEELFQSIASSVLSLKYNENIYGRAGNFTPEGTIDTTILQNSFNVNKDLVIASNNEKVITDRYGITVKSADGANGDVLRLVAGGILLSKDNGLNYTTGITADGINGELITAGQVDTSKVVIRSSDAPALQLDELGLTAYRNYGATFDANGKKTSISNPIVRHDQFGFYLARESDKFGKNWYENIVGYNSPEDYIEKNADISITQQGIMLQSEDGEALKLFNNVRTLNLGGKDVQWGSCLGSFTTSNNEILPRVRLGYIREDNGKKIHGLDIYGGCLRLYGKKYDEITDFNADNEASLYFADGDLNLNGNLNRTDNYGGAVKIGDYGGDLVFSSGWEKSINNFSSIQLTKSDAKLTMGLAQTQVEDGNASISFIFPQENPRAKTRTLFINSGYTDSWDDTLNGANLWIQAGRFKAEGTRPMEGFARICLQGNHNNMGETSSSIQLYANSITKNNVEIDASGSDLSIKHNINNLSEKYSMLFDRLRPVSFVYNEGEYGYGSSQRAHTGFIANEVEQALEDCGLTTQEFAGYIKQEDGLRCLRYTEFIALCVKEIQDLKKLVAKLLNNP